MKKLITVGITTALLIGLSGCTTPKPTLEERIAEKTTCEQMGGAYTEVFSIYGELLFSECDLSS